MSHINYWVTVTLTSDLVSRIIVRSISPILFEVVDPNLVGWSSVAYHFDVTDLDLISRIIV